MLERYPQVVRWTRASGTTCGKGEVPSLGKGGVAAPSSKWSHSFEGAAGVVRSTSDNRWLEPTTPSAPAKEAPRHFLQVHNEIPILVKREQFIIHGIHGATAVCR